MYWITLALLALFIGLSLTWVLAIFTKATIHWTVTVIIILGTASLLYLPTFYGAY